jgi:hypothetical protein
LLFGDLRPIFVPYCDRGWGNKEEERMKEEGGSGREEEKVGEEEGWGG